jgi:hypothetical protein
MSAIDSLIRVGIRRGFQQGLLRGNRLWMVVGGLAIGARVAQRMIRRTAVVAYQEELAPGEKLVITHFVGEPPPLP